MTDNLPATYDPNFTGLEDFELEDAVIPRLKIMHKEGTFKDNLSGATFERIRVIILAMNKQRILWHPQVDDGDKPMCRSADFNLGFPISREDATKGKEFPWDKSGFTREDMEPDPTTGEVVLECGRCELKEWGSHPLGKIPYCAEQWTLSVLYDGINPDGSSSGIFSIALLTLQKSGLKAIKSYLTSFQRAKKPAFTAICEVSLNVQQRGDVSFSTPSFINVGQTEQANWIEYGQQAQQMRDFLKRAPEPIEDDTTGAPQTSDNSYNAPPSAQQAPAQDPWAAANAETERKAAEAAAQQAANQAHQAPPAQPPVQQPAAQQPPVQQPVSTPPPSEEPPAQPASTGTGLPF